MDTLLEMPLIQALSDTVKDQKVDYKELYKEFTYKVLELCNATEMDFSTMIFTLNHTNIELTTLQETAEGKSAETLLYIKKAILFTQSAIGYLNSSQLLESRTYKTPVATQGQLKKWTTKIIHLVEIIYALDTVKCVDSGSGTLEELSDYISRHWGIEIKNCFHVYVDMKKRKGESRTYFLDELSRRLNERMQRDDEKGLSLSGN